MKISDVAKLTGVTVRTLHHYDSIGLLKPSRVTDAGYRLYSAEDLEKLQQILFFRELDFSLRDIRDILADPHFDRKEALHQHRNLLLQKQTHIHGLIRLIDQTLQGDDTMSFKEFDTTELENAKKQYAEEAKQRWGATQPYAEYEEKTANYDDPQWKLLQGEGAAILKAFGEIRHLDPAGDEAQALVKKWQDFITSNFYTCTKPILSCLGQMYIDDDRFTQNIDRNGEGTALFLATAIEIYCKA